MSSDSKKRNTEQLLTLAAGEIGDRTFDQLFTSCQQELRAVANNLMQSERTNHTLQPTALVNEAYLRLFEVEEIPVAGRVHFVNLAARSMRQILVDHARQKGSAKRGGGWQAVTLTGLPDHQAGEEIDLLDLHEALEKLADLDERVAGVVELRFFGGMNMEEIAQIHGLTRRTVQKDWRFALMWLRAEFAER